MVSYEFVDNSVLMMGSVGWSIQYVMCLVKIDPTIKAAQPYIWLARIGLAFTSLIFIYLIFPNLPNASLAAHIAWLIQGGIQLILVIDRFSVSQRYREIQNMREPLHHHARRHSDRVVK